jgi:hypothetical protein
MGLARRFRPDLVFLNLEAGNCYICWKRLRESTFDGPSQPHHTTACSQGQEIATRNKKLGQYAGGKPDPAYRQPATIAGRIDWLV